jgi:hypothetical protein
MMLSGRSLDQRRGSGQEKFATFVENVAKSPKSCADA